MEEGIACVQHLDVGEEHGKRGCVAKRVMKFDDETPVIFIGGCGKEVDWGEAYPWDQNPGRDRCPSARR